MRPAPAASRHKEGAVKNLFRRQPLGAAAMVIALIALSVAIVGPAFAGKKSAKIGTKQLKNLAVTEAKLANLAVTNGKLGNESVTGGKLATGAVTQSKLANIEAIQKTLPVGVGPASNVDTVDCPAGTRVISGGAAYVVTNTNQDIQVR